MVVIGSGGLFQEGFGDIKIAELHCILMWFMEFLKVGVIFLELLVMLSQVKILLEACLWHRSASKGRLEGVAGKVLF